MIFEILEIKPTEEAVILGTVNFELNQIEKQEEYDITLEVCDDEVEGKINAVIYSKIFFVWSQFAYYNDQYLKSESLVNSYKSVLDKSNSLLENLNGKIILTRFNRAIQIC